jgi:hypothetical protein
MSYDPGAASSAAFRAYVHHFDLTLLGVSLVAKVRLLTVWKIEQGLPIRAEDALAVRAGLQQVTGVPYSAHIPVIPAGILLMTQASQARRKEEAMNPAKDTDQQTGQGSLDAKPTMQDL